MNFKSFSQCLMAELITIVIKNTTYITNLLFSDHNRHTMRKKTPSGDGPSGGIEDEEGAPNISDEEKLALGNVCNAIPVKNTLHMIVLSNNAIFYRVQ